MIRQFWEVENPEAASRETFRIGQVRLFGGKKRILGVEKGFPAELVGRKVELGRKKKVRSKI